MNPDFDLQEELKKLPHKPGVYIMHDKKDAILYVGKAINLNRRVHQYFVRKLGRGAKIERMVSRIAWFEYSASFPLLPCRKSWSTTSTSPPAPRIMMIRSYQGM